MTLVFFTDRDLGTAFAEILKRGNTVAKKMRRRAGGTAAASGRPSPSRAAMAATVAIVPLVVTAGW